MRSAKYYPELKSRIQIITIEVSVLKANSSKCKELHKLHRYSKALCYWEHSCANQTILIWQFKIEQNVKNKTVMARIARWGKLQLQNWSCKWWAWCPLTSGAVHVTSRRQDQHAEGDHRRFRNARVVYWTVTRFCDPRRRLVRRRVCCHISARKAGRWRQ